MAESHWIGIVSDTHGHAENARRAAVMLESLEVEQVIHCGDIGSPEIAEVFAKWPTHYVFGNCDYQGELLRMAIEKAGGRCHDLFGSLQVAGRNIAFLHSHERKRFEEACRSGVWDVVCYGHSHLAEQHQEGSTLVLNPGALYRASSYTIAILEVPKCAAHFVTV